MCSLPSCFLPPTCRIFALPVVWVGGGGVGPGSDVWLNLFLSDIQTEGLNDNVKSLWVLISSSNGTFPPESLKSHLISTSTYLCHLQPWRTVPYRHTSSLLAHLHLSPLLSPAPGNLVNHCQAPSESMRELTSPGPPSKEADPSALGFWRPGSDMRPTLSETVPAVGLSPRCLSLLVCLLRFHLSILRSPPN